jgi:hypothetical protein
MDSPSDPQAPARTAIARYNEAMAKKRTIAGPCVQPNRYPSLHIPRAAIRRFARGALRDNVPVRYTRNVK